MDTGHFTARLPAHPRALAATWLVAALLVGCGSAPEPIRIGSAPTTPTGKIDLALPVDSSGFFVFDRWPDACDLLTDRDVRAVFPQARDIARKREEQMLKVLPNLLSTAPAPTTRDVTVPNASCDVAFSLPGVEREDKFPFSTGYQLTIKVDYAGTEKVVRENHGRPSKGEARARLGGADCRVSSSGSGSFSCIKGRLAFELSTGLPIDQGEFDGKRTLRYQLGREVTTFASPRDDNRYQPESDAYKRAYAVTMRKQGKFEGKHIRSELVKAVASKF